MPRVIDFARPRGGRLWTPGTAGGGGGGVADPTEIANLLFWYDASDETSITDTAGAVSAWNDKSGNDNHLNANANGLTTGARTINSLNVIDFDGVNDYIESVDMGTVSQPVHLFMVVQHDNVGSNTVYFDKKSTASTQAFFGPRDNPAVLANAGTGVEFDYVMTGGPYILEIVFDGASSAVYVDGVLRGTGNIGTAFPNAIRLGTTYVAGNDFDGAMAEVCAYTAVLSSSDAGSVRAYLFDKWGFTASTDWNPLDDVGNVVAWYDASDESTIIHSSGTITRWANKAGPAAPLEQAGGNDATTGDSTINSLNVVDFPGGARLAMSGTITNPGQPMRLFMIVRIDDLSRDSCILSGDSAPFTYTGIWNGGTNYRVNAGTSLVGGTPTLSNGVPVLWEVLFDGASSELFINGASALSGDAGTGGIDKIHLGATYAGTASIDGAIGEFILFDGDVAADAATIRTNVATKWGITLA